MSHVEGCVWFVSFQREPGVPKPNGGGVVMQRNLCGRMISFFLSVLAVGMLLGVSTSCRWGGGSHPKMKKPILSLVPS